METVKGIISRVIYHNEENGYTVASLLLEIDGKEKSKKNKILGKTISIVGCFDREPIEEEQYEVTGEYKVNPKFGLQFQFTSFKRLELTSYMGIVSYLSSEIFPGIGVKIAKKVVEKLGSDCLKLIKANSNVLDDCGLTPTQKSSIIQGLKKESINHESLIFLLDHGISLPMANKILSAFTGDDDLSLLKENPYKLIGIARGFGFKKADLFALSIGIKKDATCRLKALVEYSVKDLLNKRGDSYIMKMELYNAIISYINEDLDYVKYEEILNQLQEDKKIIMTDDLKIFDFNFYYDEIDLAREIHKLLKGERNSLVPLKTYKKEKIEKIFKEINEESTITFSDEQVEAILAAFTEPMVIITGGPGTGKTTIVQEIIKLYLRLNKNNSTLKEKIALLAPTGRAAKRLSESCNMEASTIHKFLGYNPDGNFEYNKFNKTDARLLIVDEASMMDLQLASKLITSMHYDARIIIVGDVDQLPSVGPGQVLKDLIDSKLIKTVRLTKIHRQAEDSSIIRLASSINEGIVPEDICDRLSDRRFLQIDTENLARLVVDFYEKSLQRGKEIKDIQILIPTYKTDCGIVEINRQIQERINPKKGAELVKGDRIFRPGDKVIQLVNRAEKNVMNGDMGFIESFSYENGKINGVNVQFDTLVVSYTLEEADDLSLAYAISIHKSQGSEFDCVIMPFTNLYFIMLKRKLIYTGVTRAKKTLIMMGDLQAFQRGITRIEGSRRTILKDVLLDLENEQSQTQIKDNLSAFSEIKEKNFGKLTPLDFMDNNENENKEENKDSVNSSDESISDLADALLEEDSSNEEIENVEVYEIEEPNNEEAEYKDDLNEVGELGEVFLELRDEDLKDLL